jgi:molybdate transport system ATP-binding protein
MQIKNLLFDGLEINDFITSPGESWCIYGRNRSGIDCFVDLFTRNPLQLSADILQLPQHPGLVSFQAQQEIFENELRNDDTDILDRIDPGTPVRDFLPEHSARHPLVKSLGMEKCLDVGYRYLSSGQCRKLLLLRELMGGATTLVLQNPYDGLDEPSCCELDQALRTLPSQGIELILTVNTVRDIPLWCSHLALIRSGHMFQAGPKEQVMPLVSGMQEMQPIVYQAFSDTSCKFPLDNPGEELIFLQEGSAGYGNMILFSNLNLAVNRGDHTLITGPNGCGKSTLLDIITGDNPRCYTSRLRIFGKNRGSGESIWDIKKHMGIVSPGLHRDYRVPGSALSVVLSGLFDSIGLYRKVGTSEIKTGLLWLDWIGLRDKAGIPFRRLPYAEQRMVLIARALIKYPKLLILDEPTQGLDDVHRQALLDLLEKITQQKITTILFVSHRKDEHRPFFNRCIQLETYAP